MTPDPRNMPESARFSHMAYTDRVEGTRAAISNVPTHPQYDRHLETWVEIRTAIAGARAVRAAAHKFLPPREGMKNDAYERYLSRAVFFNAVARTVQGLMGAVFRRPPEFNAPAAYVDEHDFTKYHESLSAFSQYTASELLSVGRSGALVDMPPRENSGKAFAVSYRPEDIVNWRYREINGRFELEQVFLREYVEIPGEIGFDVAERYRLLALDGEGYYYQQIYTMVKAPNENKTTLVPDSGAIYPKRRGLKLKFIPFRFFGPEKNVAEIQKSPVEDIHHLNISHYQTYTALEHARYYTASPVYYVKSDTAIRPSGSGEENIEGTYYVGPDHLWELGKEDSVGIVEFNGSGLQSLESGLSTKELQMAALGARLINQQKKLAAISTSATEIAQLGEEAILLRLVLNLNDGITDVMRWVAWWNGLGDSLEDPVVKEVYAKLNTNFKPREMQPREANAMRSLWESGLIPMDVLYKIFRDAEVLPPELSLEEFAALLKDPKQVPKTAEDDRVVPGVNPAKEKEQEKPEPAPAPAPAPMPDIPGNQTNNPPTPNPRK